MLDRYTFVENEYPFHPVSGAIASTRGRNPDGSPKVHNNTNEEMVDVLEETCKGIDLDKRFYDAFRRLDRAIFVDWDNVPEEHRENVGGSPYNFLACVFGNGQTVPAANLLLTSLVLMDFQPGQRFLEIGAGSGYYASLAANVAGEGSHIYSTEIIPEFVDRARTAVERSKLSDRVTVLQADPGVLGSPENGPYDRIVTTVACSKERQLLDLIDQLAVNGTLSNTIVGLSDGEAIEPWMPGMELTPDRMVMSDPSKGFAYVVSYKFTKRDEDIVEFGLKNNMDIEKGTGAGPYFRT
jgi:protein-L-isoaspartate(D-aspartate) O-methyltransferase